MNKKIVRSGLRLAICLLLLFWVFNTIFLNEGRSAWGTRSPAWDELTRWDQWKVGWQLGPPQLWQSLTTVTPVPLFGSFLIMGSIIFTGAARWLIALRTQGLRLPWERALRISLVAHFFNSFLLGSTGGDLVKAYYAARETAHQKTEAVVTVFVDRVIGLWTMLLFAGLMVLPNLGLLHGHDRLRLLAIVVIATLFAGTGFVGLAFWGGLTRQWRGARDWLRRLPKGEWIERSLVSCREFGRNRHFFLRMMLVSMVINILCVAQYVILAHGLSIMVPLSVWLLIVPTIICIAALPITPSGLGVRENLYVVILASAPFFVAETSALTISLLAYAGSLAWSLIGGIVYLFLKDREHLEEFTGPQEI
ncbi:flippase-like domain-containing protein [bacterium]|nr:flippase-like domain-containing protein [bacterium]